MFEFYEIVKVIACSDMPHLIGKEGYISGKSYDDGGPVEAYGVYIIEMEEMFSFQPTEIASEGRFIDPDETVSGERIRVRNEDGRGVIVEDE